ncbi:MAG: serine hydrolase [Candidatus Aminicenantes bacterium]|nr:serine hydrolase [Candidatus Aminicenantes bacterium]
MKKIAHLFLVLIVIPWLLQGALQAQESPPQPEQVEQTAPSIQAPTDRAELEAFLEGIMIAYMESRHIAGATLAVVKDGEIFFTKGYGYADVEERTPVDPEKTLFRPGSVSKLFTWTAVMQLVEQGKIDLDADINIYLRDFKIPDTYPEPVTMTHLMTHTAGFEDVINEMGARSPEDLVPLAEFLARKMPARVRSPGKLTSYSNYGTALAGYILEKVAGVPFEDYVEENIFKMLDMQHSTFRQPLPSHLEDYMSGGYTYKNGLFRAEGFEYINGLAPAGSMSTTAADIAKFMIAHLQHGKYGENRILEEETAKLMHTQLFSHDPLVDGNAHGFWEMTYNNLRALVHGGDTIWFHSLLVIIPEKKLGLFVSFNSEGGSWPVYDNLMKAFLNHYYPAPEPVDIKPPPGFKLRANRLSGSYGVTRVVSTTYEKLMALMMAVKVEANEDSTLLITMPMGLGSKQWVEIEPLVFREVGGQDTVVFRENSKRRITYAFFGQIPILAAVKLAWYETPGFHYTLLAICMILFLSTLGWPASALSKLFCRHKKEIPGAPWLVRFIAGGMSALYIIFLIGMFSVVSDYMELIFGVPPLLKILLILPILSALLTIGALFFAYIGWKNKYWTVCGRLHYTLVVLASLVFLCFLAYWNLLGFHF